MFLVSWSLFSRLSRMKDSVSSSWGRGGEASPAARGCRSPRPGPQPRPEPSSLQRVPPPCPLPPSRGDARASAPSLPAAPARVSPASACPRFPAAGRTPPAGESSLRPRAAAPASVLCRCASLLGFRPRYTHFRPEPRPERPGGAMLGVAGGSAPRGPETGWGRSHLGCGRESRAQHCTSLNRTRPQWTLRKVCR